MKNLNLPIQPPVAHMLAKLTPEIPEGEAWIYEPKWDGFRCTVFYDGNSFFLQSRDEKPLGRYFPELEEGLSKSLPGPLVLDGEIVIATPGGLDFSALQMRLHPAESRVRMLAEQTPASFVAFDLLADDGDSLIDAPFGDRRARLEARLSDAPKPLRITPATLDHETAEDWFHRFEGAGLDGVIAKRIDESYKPGVRGWLKIKHFRTVDCVVGGFRWAKDLEGEAVGSLLLGLFDDAGVLHHVGHTSSFKAAEKRGLVDSLTPFISEDDADGFGDGRTPGTPSRWTGGKDMTWVRLRPELVCEVRFDYLQGDRFRHAATFLRWRFDKPPEACTYDQIRTTTPIELAQVLGAGD